MFHRAFTLFVTLASGAPSRVKGNGCEVCRLNSEEAPIFVHPQRTDGVGATIQQMIYGAAYAHSRYGVKTKM